jgi:competence protein ComEC
MKRWIAGLGVAALAIAVCGPMKSATVPPRPLDIFFVDVEGGAATLMVTPNGESVLVDSGWPRQDGRDAKRIEHAARYVAGLSQIDHYVTTHWHTDHYGGIEYLTRLMPVKHFWDRGIPSTLSEDPSGFQLLQAAYRKASGSKSRALQAGDYLRLKPAGLPLELKVVAANGRVLDEEDDPAQMSCPRHPAKPADTSDNARSLALMLSYGEFNFLNCGDLTWNIEHKLVCPENRVGDVDLWQVTHHGSDQSSNPALVDAIQPRCAVVVNGPRKGGSPDVIRLLKRTPSLQAFYQLHRQVQNSASDNAPPERIANLEENCRGEFIRVRLNRAGDRYTVYKGTERMQSFAVRS